MCPIEVSDMPKTVSDMTQAELDTATLTTPTIAHGGAAEPETFHDLCVQLGIEECEAFLAMNFVDSKEQLQMLAGYGLGKADCEEIGLDDQQRESILQWANGSGS